MPDTRTPPEGQPIWSRGRPVIAGFGPFERSLSARSGSDDLWAGLISSTDDVSIRKLGAQLATPGMSRSDVERYRAFLTQAREFYDAQRLLGPSAKPLAAYYFVLNLSEAYLTLRRPTTTNRERMNHGVSVRPGCGPTTEETHAFEFALSKGQPNGVFPQLASETGARNSHPVENPHPITGFLPYLLAATNEYTSMTGELPRLLPIDAVEVLGANDQAWLRVRRESLVRRGHDPGELSAGTAHDFSRHFRYVGDDTETAQALYDSGPVTLSHSPSGWQSLADRLDRSLVGVDRSQFGGRWYVTIDDRPGLISYEAVTFLLMHHLSEIVRYRPHHAEGMLRSRFAWVLTIWVNRACDNFLLTLASRMTGEKHRLRA